VIEAVFEDPKVKAQVFAEIEPHLAEVVLRFGVRSENRSAVERFTREIPPLARYEVRVTIGSWDHKWLYVVARYVTRRSRRHATHRSPQSSSPSTPNDVLTPAQNGSADVEHAVAAIINPGTNGTGNTRRAPIVEPDGATLHCIAVAQTCFKWGSITVPPAVVLASEGFTKPYAGNDTDTASTARAQACVRTHIPTLRQIGSSPSRFGFPLTEVWTTSVLSARVNGVRSPRTNDGGRMPLEDRSKRSGRRTWRF